MRVRLWVTLLLFLPLGVLAAANWSALFVPVPVDLFVTRVTWPLWPLLVGPPVLLALLYLGAALLDRARQLRQVAALERQLEEARTAVDRGREAALDAVATRIEARLAALESVVEGAAGGLELRLGERLGALGGQVTQVDEAQRARLDAVAARITAVRNELAADVGEAEDALLRALAGRERTLDADGGTPTPTRGALTDGER
jgi:hypothetical protein